MHLGLSGGSGSGRGGHFIMKSQPFTCDTEQGPSTPCRELNLHLHLGGRRFGAEIGEGLLCQERERSEGQPSAAVPASDTSSLP